jgi:serine/threonine-protein kinase
MGGFEKKVALKTIHDHLVEDEQFVNMFLNEARLAAQLQHPNIVQIYDLGRVGETYYMAMEYLDGEPLDALLKRGIRDREPVLKPYVVVHIVMEALLALHHAHELTDDQGNSLHLVHRDISPHNIFVTYNGIVKLVDFGIARAAGVSSATTTGTLKGKVPYMAPEQAMGKSLDRRADIFAMGVVLWEMLANRSLFKGESEFESLMSVTQKPVPPLTDPIAGIPGSLDEIVKKALQRKASMRFPTALNLHDALAQVAPDLGPTLRSVDLARLMEELFHDEIQKKKQLLAGQIPKANRVVSGAPIFDNESIEAGLVSRKSRLPQLTGSSVRPAPDDRGPGDPTLPELSSPIGRDGTLTWVSGVRIRLARRPWILPTIGGLLMVTALLANLLIPTTPPPPTSQPVKAASSLPTSPSASQQGLVGAAADAGLVGRDGRASESSLAAQEGHDGSLGEPLAPVTLSLVVAPPGATVTVDGRVQADPGAIRLPYSSKAVTIRVSARGHAPQELSFVPHQDERRQVVLERSPSSRPAKVRERPRKKRRRSLPPNPYQR